MACNTPDRNARPYQNLPEFSRTVDDRPDERQRLQELAELIPKGHGSGDEYERALDGQEALEALLEAAVANTATAFHTYRAHIAFLKEERALLQSLGLTANLFRKDSQ